MYGHVSVYLPVLVVVLGLSYSSVACTKEFQGYSPVHRPGFCIWYGQDLDSRNWLYNGPAKLISDPEEKKLLSDLCPTLDTNTTCCSTKQLYSLEAVTSEFYRYTRHCKPCYENFRQLLCQIVCSPNQSVFMDATMAFGFPPQIKVIRTDCFVPVNVAKALMTSCENATFADNPSMSVLSFLCGVPNKQCTPSQLLHNLRMINPWGVSAPLKLRPPMKWMQVGEFSGACAGGGDIYCKRIPSGSNIRKATLKITSTYPKPGGYRRYPDNIFIPFGPIFHLDLLNQALKLQHSLTDISFEGGDLSLADVCYRPSKNSDCVIESFFQYFQNSPALLNKCLTSMEYDCRKKDHPPDFFKADFHDHTIFCANLNFPEKDEIFGASCYGDNSCLQNPRQALAGFNDAIYRNATTLKITFALDQNASGKEQEESWEKAFQIFIHKYVDDEENGNLTIAYKID